MPARECDPARCERGEIRVAVQKLAARLEPVDRRTPTGAARRRARSRRKCVSRQCSGESAFPIQRSAMPTPPVKPIFAVDDEDLAMRAVLDVGERAPAQRVVPRQLVVQVELDSGLLHPLEIARIDPQAAEPVDHDVRRDTRARALGERVRELLGDLSLPVDERLERDRPLRARGSPRASRERSDRR